MQANNHSASAGAELNCILKKHRAYKDLRPSHACFLYERFIQYANYAYSNYLHEDYPPGTKLYFDRSDVYTLVEQAWKRKVYFRVFHKGVDGMNEIKEVALYCFWILKLQPFYVDSGDCASDLNAKMARYILVLGAILYAVEMNAKRIKRAKANRQVKADLLFVNTEDRVMGALLYSFRYRDWSKEAIMDLCEGLITTATVPVGEWEPDLSKVHSATPELSKRRSSTKGNPK